MKRTPYQLYLAALTMLNFKNTDIHVMDDASPEDSVAIALGTTGLPIMTEVELAGAVQKSLAKPGFAVLTLEVEGPWETDVLRTHVMAYLRELAKPGDALDGAKRMLALHGYDAVYVAQPELRQIIKAALVGADESLRQAIHIVMNRAVDAVAAASGLASAQALRAEFDGWLATDDGRDWTGEIKIIKFDQPGTIGTGARLVGGDAIEIMVDGNSLLFNRENGQCLTSELRGLLWIATDEMYRVHPDTYRRRHGSARVPTPCLDPEKMHGFCDQQGGTDDPTA